MSRFLDEVKRRWKSLTVILILTLGGGGVVGFLIRNATGFYDTIMKPGFAPPGWIFPLAWSILYLLMALSAWMVLNTASNQRMLLITLYFVQLAVNFAWPFLFFIQEALGLAFVWLLILWGLVFVLMTGFYHVRKASAGLLLPYLLWLSFAAVLNFTVALMNA